MNPNLLRPCPLEYLEEDFEAHVDANNGDNLDSMEAWGGVRPSRPRAHMCVKGALNLRRICARACVKYRVKYRGSINHSSYPLKCMV